MTTWFYKAKSGITCTTGFLGYLAKLACHKFARDLTHRLPDNQNAELASNRVVRRACDILAGQQLQTAKHLTQACIMKVPSWACHT